MKRDVHDFYYRIKNAEERIERDNEISERNKQFLKNFEEDCKLKDLGKGRISKLLNSLLKIAKWLGKDFDQADIKDIERLVMKIQDNGYSEWTKHDYKVCIKQFWKWLKKTDDFPQEVKWIKVALKKSENQNLPNEVYTQEEVEKLIDTSDNPRTKALVSLLYDSGCRISELLNIKIKDIRFEEDYALINIMGKTGNREIPISKSIPLIKAWLNYYKQRDKEAYLFPIEYKNTTKILKNLFEEAKIDKPCNPHQFRHSRASDLAKQLTEAQMNQFFGWTQASRMASTYVHLSGRDLIPKLITSNKTRKCLKCGSENPMDLKFCSKCLMPLEAKQYEKKVEKMEYEEAYKYVLENDSEIKNRLFRKMDLYLKNKHKV